MRRFFGREGFSLLEVMIAIGILSFSLLAIFSMQSTSLMGSARAQKISISTQLARQKMAQSLLEIEAGMAKGEFPDDKEDSGTFEEDKFPDYTWKLSIKKVEIPAPPSSGGENDNAVMGMIFERISKELSEKTREVKLTVSWLEFDEEEVGIVVTTHVVKM